MFCPQCRAELPDDAKYCIKCGYDFTKIKTPPEKKRYQDSLDGLGTSINQDSDIDCFKVGSLFANRYEILSEGLKGGMGVVYKCKDTMLNKIKALKVIHPRLLSSKQATSRFRQEVAISQELNHENIVRVYDIESWEGKEYFTMEWVEGVTLRDIITERKKEHRPFSIEEAEKIISQLANALSHAHKYTIHRDIKPENILITNEKELKVKLSDFGIAKMLSPSEFTSTSMQMGTPYYMAPEQKIDAAHVDKRADIYALGVVFFELLTLENTIGFELPSEINKSLPKEIDNVIKKALATKPDDRYGNAKELSDALNKVADTFSEQTERNRKEAEEQRKKEGEKLQREVEERKQKEAGQKKEQEEKERRAREKEEAEQKRIEEQKRWEEEQKQQTRETERKRTTETTGQQKSISFTNKAIAAIAVLVIIIGVYVYKSKEEPSPEISSPPVEAPASVPTPSPIDSKNKNSQLKTSADMVFVKGACYEMGCGSWTSECYDEEKPVHEVCVDDFFMGKYEVTVGEFRRFVNDTGYKSEAEKSGGCYVSVGLGWRQEHSYNWKNPGYSQDDNHPVACVSWNDANAYADWITSKTGKNYRLATEAEWEYAARSGGKREKYAGGNDVDAVAWYPSNSSNQAHPVGQKSPNELGIYDMSGNVREWVSDWFDLFYYKNSPRNNPKGPNSSQYGTHVERGGGWADYGGTRHTRTTDRSSNVLVHWKNFHGFRLVMSTK